MLPCKPAEDGSGVKELERLVVQEGYHAVRFNPYLWPAGQQDMGRRTLLQPSKMIKCSRFQVYVLVTRMTNEIGKAMFSKAGQLGIPVGFMCMKGLNLHISEIEELCMEFPSTIVFLDHLAFCKPPINDEESLMFSKLLHCQDFHCDFPFVVSECGYKQAKEAVSVIANQIPLSSSDLEWVLGKTIAQLFKDKW